MDVDGCPEQDSNRESREIFIRYVFKDPDGFEKVTKQAIIWGEGAEDVCEALPDWVAGMFLIGIAGSFFFFGFFGSLVPVTYISRTCWIFVSSQY